MNRQEWLDARRQGLGGSDIAAVMGRSKWRTPLDVYLDKLGEAPELAQNADMRRGIVQEPVAADEYVTATGRAVRRMPLVRHREFPFLIGNVDRQIITVTGAPPLVEHPAPGPGVLEVKVPRISVFGRIVRQGLPDDYILQLQHYLLVTGYAWGSFAVFNADLHRLLWFDVLADAALQQQIVEAGSRFWTEHVLTRVPPPTATVATLELPQVEGQLVKRDDEAWAQAVRALVEAQELKQAAADLEEATKAHLKELMGAMGVAEGAGVRAYWRVLPGRVSFDRKGLALARPVDRDRLFQALSNLAEGVEWEPADLVRAMGQLDLDLDLRRFEKVGKPIEEFRPIFLGGES
jgi:putative phage-type endonuclease